MGDPAASFVLVPQPAVPQQHLPYSPQPSLVGTPSTTVEKREGRRVADPLILVQKDAFKSVEKWHGLSPIKPVDAGSNDAAEQRREVALGQLEARINSLTGLRDSQEWFEDCRQQVQNRIKQVKQEAARRFMSDKQDPYRVVSELGEGLSNDLRWLEGAYVKIGFDVQLALESCIRYAHITLDELTWAEGQLPLIVKAAREELKSLAVSKDSESEFQTILDRACAKSRSLCVNTAQQIAQARAEAAQRASEEREQERRRKQQVWAEQAAKQAKAAGDLKRQALSVIPSVLEKGRAQLKSYTEFVQLRDQIGLDEALQFLEGELRLIRDRMQGAHHPAGVEDIWNESVQGLCDQLRCEYARIEEAKTHAIERHKIPQKIKMLRAAMENLLPFKRLRALDSASAADVSECLVNARKSAWIHEAKAGRWDETQADA